MRFSSSKNRVLYKVTSVLTAAFFLSGGTFVPSSFATPSDLTQNETRQFVPVVTLDQANSQTTKPDDPIPSGGATPNDNPLSIEKKTPQRAPAPAPVTRDVFVGGSIQTAIDLCSAGDTVYLHAGTYHENVVLKQGVQLKGEDEKQTVLTGDFTAGNSVIRALGDNRIENLTVCAARALLGQTLGAITIEGADVKVRGDLITNNLGAGINITTDASDILIEGNTFVENNVAINGAKNGNVIRYNTITGNNPVPPDPQITGYAYIQGRGFQMNISGASGIYSYRIEYTSDLIHWKSLQRTVSPGVFEEAFVLANPSGVTTWLDDGSLTGPRTGSRFYRVSVAESFTSYTGIKILGGQAPLIQNNIIANQKTQSIWEAVPGSAVVENNVLFNNKETGDITGTHLPPAISPKSGQGWTNGNVLMNPVFVSPSTGDYTSVSNPDIGSFVPPVLRSALDRASLFNTSNAIEPILTNGQVTGYRIAYAEGSHEEFYNDGRQVLDTTGPVISALSAAVTNQSQYELRYTVDNVPYSETRTLGEGDNIFTISAADMFGNTTDFQFTVKLDTVPPAIVVTSTVPSLTNHATLLVKYTVDGGAEQQQEFTLVEGENTGLMVTATDEAKNSTTITLPKVVLDSFASDFTWINSGTGASLWSAGANWLGGIAPTLHDIAVFGSYAIGNCIIDATASVLGITLSSGYTGTITQQANVNVTGNFSQAGGHWVDLSPTNHTFNVGGSFSIPDAAAGFNRFGDRVNGAYQVRDIYDLQALNGFLSDNFRLARNIDASSTASWNSGAGFDSIGNWTGQPLPNWDGSWLGIFDVNFNNAFTGNFDGAGYAINGLTINRPNSDYLGLFSYLDPSATIHDLGLTGVNVMGRDAVGGLVGMNGGAISNAYVSGTVSGRYLVGILAGFNHGASVSGSHSSGTVSGAIVVGGLVGYNYGASSITRSYSSSTVTGTVDSIGGLVGYNFQSYISDSYATGNVTGHHDFTGGLVGYNWDHSRITNSYATGAVTGDDAYVGGLAGGNAQASSISNSFATGIVSGGGVLGGLLGMNWAGTGWAGLTPTNSYFTDGAHNNGYGTYQAGGASAFYSLTHRVYAQSGQSPWDFFSTWSASGSALPRLYQNTQFQYQWNVPQNGLATESVYAYRNGVSALIAKTVYANGVDHDPTHKTSWPVIRQLTYYASGNLKSWKEQWNNTTYTYEDSDYFSFRQGPSASLYGVGRLIQYSQPASGDGTDVRTLEYSGDSLNVIKHTKEIWNNSQLVSREEISYYDEALYDNPQETVDASGNKYISMSLPDGSGSWTTRLIKYDIHGVYQWSVNVDSAFSTSRTCNAVDSSGNVYLAAVKSGQNNLDVTVYKYNSRGVLQTGSPFVYAASGARNDIPSYLLIDSADHIFLSGVSGNNSDTNLFVVRLNTDLTQVWTGTYRSAGSLRDDHGGYLTSGVNGGVVLHGAQKMDSAYYQVSFDANGVQRPVEVDPGEHCFGNNNEWYAGRWSQETDSGDGSSTTWTSAAYMKGTEATLVERTEGETGAPASFGGMTGYYFYDAAVHDVTGGFYKFDNGATGEAVFPDGDTDSAQFTKLSYPGGDTLWFLWGDSRYEGESDVVIKKTAAGDWTAYTFDPNATTLEEQLQGWTLIGTVADPGSLELPELGDWTTYNDAHGITVEYPGLSLSELLPPSLINTTSLTVAYNAYGVAKIQTFTGLTEGANKLTITEPNFAGMPLDLHWNVTVDTIPPVVTMTDSQLTAVPALTNQPELAVTFMADGVETAGTVHLTEGVNANPVATVCDQAHNCTDFVVPKTVTLDTVPPMIAITSEVPTLTDSHTVTIHYTVDGGPEQTQVFENLAWGVHALSISAADALGNSRTLTRNVTVSSPFTWVNNSTGASLWAVGANWLGGVAPSLNDIAVFGPSALGDCIIDAAASLLGINIASGYTGTITQQADVRLSGDFSQESGHWFDADPTSHVFSVGASFSVGDAVAGFNRYGDQVSGAYQVRDIYDLQAMNGFLSDNFLLAGGVDASSTAGWNGGAGFDPLMNFTGTFDGAGNTILSLTIDRPAENSVGLFGSTGSGASISNINLVDLNVTGNDSVGGLAGVNGGSVSNAYVAGKVTGRQYLGGLAGVNDHASIFNSAAAVTVSEGSEYGLGTIGGLVGYNTHSAISNSHATGAVGGYFVSEAGGLVGVNEDSSIEQSYATGSVGGYDGTYFGGLVGRNYDHATINESFATGPVTVSWSGSSIGGLVGGNLLYSLISNSYSTSAVSGEYTGAEGGLVGGNSSNSVISNSYASGDVTGASRVGGLVGDNRNADILNSFETGAISVSGYFNGNFGGTIWDNAWSDEYAPSVISSCAFVGSAVSGVGETNFAIPLDNEANKNAFYGSGRSLYRSWDLSNVWASFSYTLPHLRWENFPDTTPPAGNIFINRGASYTKSIQVTVTMGVTDAGAGVDQMRFSVDGGAHWTAWEDYGVAKALQLTGSDGSKTVLSEVKDKAGNVAQFSDQITLDTMPPAILVTSAVPSLTKHAALLVKYTVDGGAEQQKEFTLAEGENTGLTITATDAASNSTTITLAKVVLDSAASDFTWVSSGTGANLWSIGANWLGGIAPTLSDVAVFGPYALANCIIDAAASVLGITLSSDYTGTITQQANVNVTGDFAQAGGQWVDLNPTAHTFHVGGSFSVPAAAGAFNRYGDQIAGAYQVRDVYDLQAMNGFLSENFTLANNIDASSTIHWNSGAGFNPVGYTTADPENPPTNPFRGNLNGSSHTIAGLYINRPGQDNIGLFGTQQSSAISNVGLLNVNITGDGEGIGGLVGGNGGTISDSYVTGTVTGGSYVGGLVGWNDGNITRSYSAAIVSGASDLGGLSGDSIGTITYSYATGNVSGGAGARNIGGLIGSGGNNHNVTNSYATGNVSGGTSSENIGGLVGSGYSTTGSIANSYASGVVSGGTGSKYIGGFIGSNSGNIANVYASGNVSGGTGSQYIGGLAGGNFSGSITHSYATGNVIGLGGAAWDDIGGLVGSNGGSIANSFATGTVTGNLVIGGLVGYSSGTILRSYFTDNTHGSQTGKGAYESGGASAFYGASHAVYTAVSPWDFVNVWKSFASAMPHLKWENYVVPAIAAKTTTAVTATPVSSGSSLADLQKRVDAVLKSISGTPVYGLQLQIAKLGGKSLQQQIASASEILIGMAKSYFSGVAKKKKNVTALQKSWSEAQAQLTLALQKDRKAGNYQASVLAFERTTALLKEICVKLLV